MITETEDRIISRLGISQELYSELMFDSGCLWLDNLKAEVKQRMPGRSDKLDVLFHQVERHPLFWRWWTLEWQATDLGFLRCGGTSRHSYFTRQTEARRDMPSNVSLQLLKYAARQRVPVGETEKSSAETGRADRPVIERI
jgi:hypothetical protein